MSRPPDGPETPVVTNIPMHSSPAADVPPHGAEVHLCDNYAHLLVAVADLAGRAKSPGDSQPLLLFIDDQLPMTDRLFRSLTAVANVEIQRVSDRDAIESFARLPRVAPPMLRRNLSWTGRGVPIRPASWTPQFLEGRTFSTGFVYHPGFFLSKVLAGRCDRVVMRDSGYSNYVQHRVPWQRALPRRLAGRPGRLQTWGEEPWVDEIEVVRPDQLPPHVRDKASRLTLDDLMTRLTPAKAHEVAMAFWGEAALDAPSDGSTALLLTQPIDQLGICTTAQKADLYEQIADRLRALGFGIVVKPHPREDTLVLLDEQHIPPSFPIEAWAWLGQTPFDLGVSLNSASLAAPEVSFARQRLQLVQPERFYPEHWEAWPALIEESFAALHLDQAVTATTEPPNDEIDE